MTICWDCRNAVPEGKYGCSWSRKLIPVEGWVAEPTVKMSYKVNGYKRIVNSYCVMGCPLFIPDEEKK